MDNTQGQNSAKSQELLYELIREHQARIKTLERQVQGLMILVDELGGIPRQMGRQYQAGLWAGHGYQSQSSKQEQQPDGWYGYFGDADGPLK